MIKVIATFDLQSFMSRHTFKLEEELYEREGVKVDKILFIDNQPILDLIESKPGGLLPLLDEELRIPNTSDATYVNKVKEKNSRNKALVASLKDKANFSVVSLC